jgi:hypothetical protein
MANHCANNLSRNFHSRLGIPDIDVLLPMDLKIRLPTSQLPPPTPTSTAFDAVERLHGIIFGLGFDLRVDGLTKSK